MKYKKTYERDFDKRIHKVQKSNVEKHRKPIYNYEVDEDFLDDLDNEKYLDEVDTSNIH